MGIFDSKKVREEKKIYRLLLVIKNDSNSLQATLAKTEKEFLSSYNKDWLICIYNISCELMKDNEIVKWFNLKNLGDCFDLVSKYGRGCYSLEFADVMNYVKTQLDAEIILKKNAERTRKEERENVGIYTRIGGMMQQQNNTPGAVRVNGIVSEQARTLDLKRKIDEFDDKFPQYIKLKGMIIRLELGVAVPEEVELSNMILAAGKEINPDFTLDDLLLPYLTEKELRGILIEKNEIDIYQRKIADICAQDSQKSDIKLMQYLKEYIRLNFKFFMQNNQNVSFVEFLEPFKKTLVEMKMITDGLGTKLLSEKRAPSPRR